MDHSEAEEDLKVDGLLESLRASLLDSTYSQPVVAKLEVDDAAVELNVVVTSMRSHFIGFPPDAEPEATMGCWNRPEWEFEAVLMRPPFDPDQDLTKLRITLEVDKDGKCERASLHRIPADA